MCYFTFHCLSKFYAQLFGGGFQEHGVMVLRLQCCGTFWFWVEGESWTKFGQFPSSFFLENTFFFFFFYIKHHKTLIAYNVNLLSRKCLPGTCMQTVFKVRHFYKALNQQRSHVLIERKRERRKKRRSKLCGASHRSHHISAPLCFFFFLLDKHWPLSGRWMEWEGTNCWTKGRCGRLMQETASFWAHKFVCLI